MIQDNNLNINLGVFFLLFLSLVIPLLPTFIETGRLGLFLPFKGILGRVICFQNFIPTQEIIWHALEKNMEKTVFVPWATFLVEAGFSPYIY